MKNGKHIFFAVVICFITNQSYTQNSLFSIGAFGGQNFSTMRGTSYIDDNHTNKTGFTGGLTFNYQINDILSFQPEIVFERKGSTAPSYEIRDLEGYSLGFLYGGDYHYDYLTIPLLLNVSIGKNLKLFVNLGSYLSYLINQTDDYSTVVIGNTNNMYPAKSFDFGIVTGIGFEIPLNENVSLFFEGRNNLGLLDIGDIPSFYDHGPIKHNSIAIMGGLKYNF